MHPSPYVRNTTTVSKFAMKVETPVSINFYDETSESTLIGFLANHRNNWGFTRGNSELFCGNIGVLLIDCFGIDLWTILNSPDLSYRSPAVFNSNTLFCQYKSIRLWAVFIDLKRNSIEELQSFGTDLFEVKRLTW